MKSLQLYRIPFHPRDKSGLWRFLLELDQDFYIYFWLEEPDGLHSFQIIHRESIVVTLFENRITVGRINSFPFNRVIAEDGYEDEMKGLAGFLEQIDSPELPNTLELIRTAVLHPFRSEIPRLRIPAEEARLLMRVKKTPEKGTRKSF